MAPVLDEMSVGDEPPSALNHNNSKERIPVGVPTNVHRHSTSIYPSSTGKERIQTRNHILVYRKLKEELDNSTL